VRLQCAEEMGSRSAVLFEALGGAFYHSGDFNRACEARAFVERGLERSPQQPELLLAFWKSIARVKWLCASCGSLLSSAPFRTIMISAIFMDSLPSEVCFLFLATLLLARAIQKYL
jgi:hypothetical protein